MCCIHSKALEHVLYDAGDRPTLQRTPRTSASSVAPLSPASRGMPKVHFANFPLRLVLPTDRVAAAADGVRQLVFRTLPSVNKIEIKRLLERLYALPVEAVHTANYEGKKKRSRGGFFRKPDFKVAYVKLKEAVRVPYSPPPPPPKEA